MTNNRVLFITSLPISFHEICCSLTFCFVTMHSVYFAAHAAGQSNATSSGALHDSRYSQCLHPAHSLPLLCSTMNITFTDRSYVTKCSSHQKMFQMYKWMSDAWINKIHTKKSMYFMRCVCVCVSPPKVSLLCSSGGAWVVTWSWELCWW